MVQRTLEECRELCRMSVSESKPAVNHKRLTCAYPTKHQNAWQNFGALHLWYFAVTASNWQLEKTNSTT